VRRRVDRVASDPLFHGMHSATAREDGALVVTCAGTDSVLELDPDGRPTRHRWLRPGSFAAAHPGSPDLRLLDHDALKPHSHHPNHAVWVGDELWVTCFEPQDCRSLTSGRAISLPEAIPHDGRLRGGLLWFTQVVGRVVAVDPATLGRALELDLDRVVPGGAGGWVRGIEVVGSRLFVGVTKLRPTRHREVLRQLIGRRSAELATRVIELDLDRAPPRLVREIPVGNAAGGTIYAITA
jgi:hypothetical protein